ncbi:MAG: septum site-determining protein MinD [Clostridiales bacterium]|nr:septum site-determining protein MinD [Clostridiales bacterium]
MAKKIVVASGKGGVGKSTLTTGISSQIAAAGKSVLVIDGDIGLRSLDLMFGLRDRVLFDWGDIILGHCEIRQAILKAKGLDLLAAPLKPNDVFTRNNFRSLIKELDDLYDYIFIDASAGITNGFRLAVGVGDLGLLVATPDDVSVRSAGIAAQEMLALGISEPRLLINRLKKRDVKKGRFLNIDEVIDSTGVQLIGVVPEDADLAFCATTGRPFVPSNPGARAFERIAARLLGKNIPLKL